MEGLKTRLKQRSELLPVIAAIVLVSGLASSALLQAFGVLQTAETDVRQSVLVNGEALDSESAPVKLFTAEGERRSLMAGSTAMGTANLTNRAETVAPVDFVTEDDDNYRYGMEDVRYDYILLERYTGIGSAGEAELKASNGSFLARGSYRASSRVDVDTVSPEDPRLGGVTFHLTENESAAVDPFSDRFISMDYAAGPEHGFPESDGGGKPGAGVIRLETDEASLKVNGERLEGFELFFDAESPETGSFSFSPNRSFVYSNGSLVTRVNSSVEASIGEIRVEEVSVLAGSLEGPPGVYHLEFDELVFNGEGLIDNRMVVPDEPGDRSRSVLRPESSYIFGGALRSSVFADPERASHYRLETSVSVPEAFDR